MLMAMIIVFKSTKLIMTYILFISLIKNIHGYDVMKKYGCKFRDKQNFYLSFDREKAQTEASFGDTLDHLVFNDEIEFNLFINRINQYADEFLTNEHYDTTDSFIKFYNNFKSQKNKLDKFYKFYKPKLEKGDFVKTIDSLFNYLVKQTSEFYPSLEEHIYFAAVKEDVPFDQLLAIYNEDPVKSTYMTYSVGVIKVRKLDAPGYIIFTTYSKPVVLIVNQNVTVDIKMFQSQDYPRLTFRLINNFVVYHLQKESNENAITNLIYLEKPYCAFQELSFRQNLLNNERYKISLINEAEFYFGFQTNEVGAMYLTKYKSNNQSDSIEFDLKYGKMIQEVEEISELQEIVKHAAKAFHTSPEQLIETLETSYEIEENRNFKKGLTKLFRTIRPIQKNNHVKKQYLKLNNLHGESAETLEETNHKNRSIRKKIKNIFGCKF